MSNDCIFCRIVAGEIPADKLYEDEEVLAFRDVNPQAPTHILVIPKDHRERLSDYTEEDETLLGHLLATLNSVARKEGLSDYRTVINCGPESGQEVFHLHAHLLGGRAFSWPPG